MARVENWLGVALASALAGCMMTEADSPDGDPNKQEAPPPVAVGKAAAALTRANSCDDLLTRIQADAAAKIALQASLLRKEQTAYGQNGVGFGTRGGGAVLTPTTAQPVARDASAGGSAQGIPGAAPAPGPTPRPATETASSPMAPQGSSKGDSESSPSQHSDTNTQVDGVDEADIVKTDGSHIYLLHGNQLLVLDSWPATATALAASISIEGGAVEMFVENGVAAVFSNTSDGTGLSDPGPAQTQGQAATDAAFSKPYYSGSPFTKVTLIDVKSAKPQVRRELFIEGSYLSSRRHGTTVRAVISGGFRVPTAYSSSIEYRDPWNRPYPQEAIDAQIDAWRARVTAAVRDTKIADWLPVEREIKNGKLGEPQRRCTDFYLPAPGLAEYGITNVVSLDMSAPMAAIGGAIVMGSADEVYSNDEVLLLAHRDYRFDQGLIERERTVLHRFALKGADTTYTASGFVPGHILDQFSLDERAGIVRVSTTARTWQRFVPPIPAVAEAAAKDDAVAKLAPQPTMQRETENRVLTLKVDGDALTVLGMTDPLGKDGEQITSTRFVDDRGYVVTFRRTDPLIVLDLKTPERIRVLGELVIPGFSEYMHPIDANHLLTIGQNADEQGFVQGLMLSIFDVTDATRPKRTHGFKYAPNGYSEASQNHKAFTFFKPKGAEGYDGLLAIPYVNYSRNFMSVLSVLQVSTEDGFKELGAIDHGQLLRNQCNQFAGGRPTIDPALPVTPMADATPGAVPPDSAGFAAPVSPEFYPCVPEPQVRRGLFVLGDEGDFVYSISFAGVLVHGLGDLVKPVASVLLPLPDYDDHRVWYGNGPVPPTRGGGTAGSGGTTPASAPGMAPAPMPTPPTPQPTPAPEPKPPVGGKGG